MKLLNYIRARFRKFIMEEIWYEDYIKRGMMVGENCSIQPQVNFDYSHCNLISIGNNVTIAPQAYLLAHDASTKRILGYTKIGLINIEDNVFIGARALIMPGVTVGKNSIVGTGSVVTKDIPHNSVAVGNPAKVIMSVDEYLKKQEKLLEIYPKFDQRFTIRVGEVNESRIEEMKRKLKDNDGFIV